MTKPSKSLEVPKIAPNTQALQTLCDLPIGGTGIVRQLSGGHEFTNVAASLGFTPGVEVTMVQNYHHGPLIVSLRDTRVALGRGEAVKILVEVV
jgi:ferrous iron transport protein A